MDSVQIEGRVPVPLLTKLNPIWWLHGPDGWDVPTINNGTPYLPDVTNIWLRRFYWFGCRNPLMNFVGFVLGVEDKNYLAVGSPDVLKTTGRDCTPQQTGFRWALIEDEANVIGCVLWGVLCIAIYYTFPWGAMLAPVFWIVSFRAVGTLPFVSFWGALPGGTWLEFYLGWRPASGGFGLKFVLTENT